MNNHNIEKEFKLQKLKDNFWNGEPIRYKIWRRRDYDGKELIVINRQNVKEVICGVLGITDTHTVNEWVNYLVAMGVLSHNPDSQQTRNGYTKPSNDTRYYLHYDKCAPTHIDSFSDSVLSEPTAKRNSGLIPQ